MIQLEKQQHGEFWVGGWYIQLTLWLDQYFNLFELKGPETYFISFVKGRSTQQKNGIKTPAN